MEISATFIFLQKNKTKETTGQHLLTNKNQTIVS